MAVDAHLHPGGQRRAGALPTHRAALAHRPRLVAALAARGPRRGIGPQAARPWTVSAWGRGRRLEARFPRPRRQPGCF
jgi:hypothetical protein